ncbi:hypothetical protein AA671_13460 [Delftia tsuruhatensis]|uniref:Uncharacterized protein n=1 Tax=Delftia tsuruhatensis TaxID=180282 RepID=A0ABM6DYJ2_9BURK|nr:hypothetical protein BI380_01175 [Delftia tsuruhatensis]KLO59378.1 hypothetical protein AA671_13460 [Delftia tsuruhatensis]
MGAQVEHNFGLPQSLSIGKTQAEALLLQIASHGKDPVCDTSQIVDLLPQLRQALRATHQHPNRVTFCAQA